MKKRIPVSKIMSTDVQTVNTQNSLHDVKQIFEKDHIHHIPVVSGDRLLGMISRTDLARVSFVADASDKSLSTAMYDVLSIDQVMVKNVSTVNPHTTIQEATEILYTHDFHGLPVVDDGKVVGIVTTHDLLKFMLDNL
jgi:CBS domain-containing protein